MNDDELNEEEQRFNNLLDGIGEEYDDLIREDEERFQKETTRSTIIMFVWLAAIIALVVAGFYFDLYTVGGVS